MNYQRGQLDTLYCVQQKQNTAESTQPYNQQHIAPVNTRYFASYPHSSFDVQISNAVRKASNALKAPHAGTA
jgi:hypothetical protein